MEAGALLATEVQLPARAGNPLRGFASGGDEDCGLRFKLRCHAKQIAVQRAAQSFVSADQHDCSFFDLAFFQERVSEIHRLRGRLALNAIEPSCEWAAVQCGLLRLAHFRRGHHLHRLGDFGGVAHRPDAPAYVACAGHGYNSEFRDPKSE